MLLQENGIQKSRFGYPIQKHIHVSFSLSLYIYCVYTLISQILNQHQMAHLSPPHSDTAAFFSNSGKHSSHLCLCQSPFIHFKHMQNNLLCPQETQLLTKLLKHLQTVNSLFPPNSGYSIHSISSTNQCLCSIFVAPDPP